MSWQPTMEWKVAQQRAEILKMIRAFFAERDVVEVETPALSNNTITDIHLEAIVTDYHYSTSGSRIPLYLQTSPEYAMKRLLASGYGDIYQLSKAFRNEPAGRIHNPEFTMLEWYRLGYDQHRLISEVAELLMIVLDVTDVEKITYQDVFVKNTAIDPLTTSLEECLSYIEVIGKQAQWLTESNDLDTLLQFIFCEQLEPIIGKEIPCFVYDFPASQASLAKINDKDERVASRFECYYKGIELVNGFDELDDYTVQLSRFNEDLDKRKALGLPYKAIDERFMQAIKHGLPNCAGVALGVDRLVMLALEAKHIQSVITFPVEKS
ncbi:MAG: elongation factor P--(R)-beta-lysine ligase [Cognaticolwellia aestuarii]